METSLMKTIDAFFASYGLRIVTETGQRCWYTPIHLRFKPLRQTKKTGKKLAFSCYTFSITDGLMLFD